MKFHLVNYTKSWEVGPEINLGSIPTVGSLVWLSSSADDEAEYDTYYVDNLMRLEKEKDEDEEEFMLFVRPYTKFGETPPLNESDHIRLSIIDLKKSVEKIGERLDSVDSRIGNIESKLFDIKLQISNLESSLGNIEDNLDKNDLTSYQSEEQMLAAMNSLIDELSGIGSNVDRIENRQRNEIDLLDDIKGRM